MLALAKGNTLYYRYFQEKPTLDNLRGDLYALPAGCNLSQKHFWGVQSGQELIALIDWIAGYPDLTTAWIGWFILRIDRQGQGLGTALLKRLLETIEAAGFAEIQLGIVEGNPQSEHFWQKNGFVKTGRRKQTGAMTIAVMKKALDWKR